MQSAPSVPFGRGHAAGLAHRHTASGQNPLRNSASCPVDRQNSDPKEPQTPPILKVDGPGRCERGFGDATGTVPSGKERQVSIEHPGGRERKIAYRATDDDPW